MTYVRNYIRGYLDSVVGDTHHWTEKDVEDVVALVLKRRAIEKWWKTELPTKGRTPREMWDSGDRTALINYVITYLDTSFT